MLKSTKIRTLIRLLASALVLSVLALPVLAQDETTCPYDPDLEWGDFQGDPPDNSKHDAETDSGAQISPYTWTATPNGQGGYTATSSDVGATSYFDKGSSWVKPGSKTPELLQHEQYHLDLSEIWARKLDAEVKGLEGTGDTADEAGADLVAKITAAGVQNKADCDAEQKKYDAETMHGTDKDKQKEWCDKISEALGVEPPNQDKLRSASIFEFNAFTGEGLIGGSSADGFDCRGQEVQDSYLLGAPVELPPLFFAGYHMEGVRPMLAPDHHNAEVRLHGPDGVALSGELRLLIAEGNRITGWLQKARIEPRALRQSRFLQLLDESLDGTTILTVSIVAAEDVSFESLSAGFTESALVPVSVKIGTAKELFVGEAIPLPKIPVGPLGSTVD